jgi:hypothetical protein
MLVRKVIKYTINSEVHFGGYIYINIYVCYEHHMKHINALCVKMQSFSTLLQVAECSSRFALKG